MFLRPKNFSTVLNLVLKALVGQSDSQIFAHNLSNNARKALPLLLTILQVMLEEVVIWLEDG